MAVVDKHPAMADEHAVADYDAGADETVAGDFAAAADFRRLLDLDEGANAGLVTDLASEEVHERRQPYVLAEFYVISDRNVAGILASGRHRLHVGWAQRYHRASVLEREVGRLKHAYRAKGRESVGPRSASGQYAVDEMPALHVEWPGFLEPRRRDLLLPLGSPKLAVITVERVGSDHSVVQPDLVVTRRVVEEQRLLRADDSGAASLERTEPAHVDEDDHVGRKPQREHRHVFDSAPAMALALASNRRWHRAH